MRNLTSNIVRSHIIFMLTHQKADTQHGNSIMTRISYELDCKGFSEFGTLKDGVLEQMRSYTHNIDSPKFEFIHFDPVLFTSIFNYHGFMDIIREFCGDNPRLDNHFGVKSKYTKINVHGGPGSYSGSTWYFKQLNKKVVTNFKVGIMLDDSNSFGYMPGSHSSCFDLQKGKASDPDTHIDPSCFVRPTIKAGSIFMFIDSIVHGTLANDDRCALYYTFTPGFVALNNYIEPQWYNLVPNNIRRFIRNAGVAIIDPIDRNSKEYVV